MSNIEWTDKTWNPVTGCTKVSPGCKNCYAEGVAERFWAKQYPLVALGSENPRPREFTDLQTHRDRLAEPLHWKKPCMVFVNSMSDLFHEDLADEFIDRVFAVMALAREHTFQVLTKRPARMLEYVTGMQYREASISTAIVRTPWWTSPQASPCAVGTIEDRIAAGPLPNVWLGVSVENQKYADERIPLLLKTPAAVRFLSVEPMLEKVSLTCVGTPENHLDAVTGPESVDWVICGGESGPGARPFNLAWAESLLKQCQAAGVPFFMKQIGSKPEWPCTKAEDGIAGTIYPPIRDRKGGSPEDWPEHLRVREFPSPQMELKA